MTEIAEVKKANELLNEKVTEIIYRAVNATKRENSDLIGSIDTQIGVLQTQYLNIHETLERVEAQTTKTNGRVTNLEKENASSKGWIKGVAVFSGVVIILMGVIYSLTVSNLEAKIEAKSITK